MERLYSLARKLSLRHWVGQNRDFSQPSKCLFFIGPRIRAPLGAKTTNAKAAFKTPGLQADSLKTQKTKQRGSSIKKPKKAEIEVHQAQSQVTDASDVDDVPDVEYAPPKPKGKIYSSP